MSGAFNIPEVNEALRTVGWYTVEHAFHADVFINIWPVHPFAITDESKVCALRRCRFRQSPGPGDCRKRHLRSAHTFDSSVMAKGCTGQILMKTSAWKACSTVYQP